MWSSWDRVSVYDAVLVLRAGTRPLRTLFLFFPGWNRWGKHWQLSFLSASLYDPLAEGSRVQCHHGGSEKVKDAIFMRNILSCKEQRTSMREGKCLPWSQQPPAHTSSPSTMPLGPPLLTRDAGVSLRAELSTSLISKEEGRSGHWLCN